MPSSSGSCDYWSVSPSHYLKCGPRTWIIGSADEVAFERYPYDRPFTMAYVQLGSALGFASNSETDFIVLLVIWEMQVHHGNVYTYVCCQNGRAIFSFGRPRVSFGRPLADGRPLFHALHTDHVILVKYEIRIRLHIMG